MAKIKTRYSIAAGATLPVGLTTGELAVNIVQRRMFVGGAAGTVELAGLSANAFTGLQLISAGLCAAGGVTFTSDIRVGSLRIGNGISQFSTNVVVGADAFISNTLGISNTAVGNSALRANTIGTGNVGIGAGALSADSEIVSTGNYNTAVGSGALYFNETGDENVAIGKNALGNLADGGSIVSIGAESGNLRPNGSPLNSATGGIYVGWKATGSTNGQINEIVIGTQAVGMGSNTAVLGATAQSAAYVYGLVHAMRGVCALGATFNGFVAAYSGISVNGSANFGGSVIATGFNGRTLQATSDLTTINSRGSVVYHRTSSGGSSSQAIVRANQNLSSNINIDLPLTSGTILLDSSAVTALNGITGGITLNAGTNIGITFSRAGGITISSSGAGSGGVTSFNGLSGAILFAGGLGGQGITVNNDIENPGVVTPAINYKYGGIDFFYETVNSSEAYWYDRFLLQAGVCNGSVSQSETMYLTDLASLWYLFQSEPPAGGPGGMSLVPPTPRPLVFSFNGRTGHVQGVSAAVAGTGISVSGATGTVTITNIGVQSFNGLTGAVTGVGSIVAGTNVTISPTGGTGAVTINATQPTVNNGTLTMNTSGSGITGTQTFTANQSGNATFTVTSNATNANTGSTIVFRDASGNFSAGTITAALTGTASNASALGNTAAASWALLASPTFTGTPAAPTAAVGTNTTQIATTAFVQNEIVADAVTSFNGRTGSVQGVSAAVAGNGISVSGATGAVTITNTGVLSFNGNAGAVTGASLGANTFTALNTFNAGIKSNIYEPLTGGAGITFGLLSGGGQGNIHFLASEIRVGGILQQQGITLTTPSGVTLTVRPRHNMIVSPINGEVTITNQGTALDLGTRPSILIQNDGTGNGQVRIAGGDLRIGTKFTSGSLFDSPCNIVFLNQDGVSTTITTAASGSNKTITLPNNTGTVVVDAAANTFTALQSFTAGISASGGITFANALSVAGNLNSTGLLNSTGGISAAGGITFNANINLQNAEFIRNTTNGRMDFMPSPSGSGNYGLYTDFTSWGFGARLGTIRSSDQALNVGAVLFDTDCVLLGSRFFAMEPGQTIKFLASGPDSNNNNTLQCTLNMSAGKTGNAFVLMDMTATGYGSTRVPSVSFTNPNFFIYSGTATRVNANDFVRFEHNITDGRIVSGGTSGISIEPGSGTVGISGGVSAGAYILNSSGIKALTGTTYTFIATDNGRVLTHDNASGCTVTIPTGLPVGFSTTLIQLNSAGRVGFTAASGVTMNTYNGWTGMAGQHASASVVSYATNIFNLSGTLA